jgi:hypothetical protein
MKKYIILSAVCTLVGIFFYQIQNGSSIDLSSLSSRSIASPQKNICSITINSDDEIRMFKKKLATDGRFKFTELINDSSKWFDQSCDSQVQCDVLIISGHFGGTFFGKSGNHLSLSELESKSCSKSCTGILQQPKEVYLFGCNTLSGKGNATRSPEQYLHVLLEDGLERNFAERVVEARYGPSGEENANRMKRVFPGVPVIYGFCDKAPLGAEAGPILQRYLSGKSKDDYYNRLEKLESIKKNLQPYSQATIQQMIDIPLATSFKSVGRCFSQLTGVDTKDDISGRICTVRDTKASIEDRAKHLNFLMRSKESLSYIELCNDFFSDINNKSLAPNEHFAVEQIKNNQKLRDDLEILLDKVTFFLGFDYGVLSAQLGLDKSKITPILSREFAKMVNKGLTREEINLMVNSDFKHPFKDFISINYNDVNTGVTFSNGNSIEAIGLTKTQDPQIINHLQKLMSSAPESLQVPLLETLIRLNAVDVAMRDQLVSMLYNQSSEIRANAIRALGLIKVYDEKIVNELIAHGMRETDLWALKKSIVYFTEVKFDSPSIRSYLARQLSHSSVEARVYSAQSLAQRSIREHAVFDSLIIGLNDANGEVKFNCKYALKINRQNIPSDLVARIRSNHPNEAIYIFGH